MVQEYLDIIKNSLLTPRRGAGGLPRDGGHPTE